MKNILIVILIFNSFVTGAFCKKNENHIILRSSSVDEQDTAIQKLITRNSDIITQCLFSTEIIDFNIRYNQNKRVLDVNILDSLISLNKNEVAIYNYILLKKNQQKQLDYIELLNKWCYCYRLFEAVFLFNLETKKPNYSFENIAFNIPELKPIFYKYISLKLKQSVNSLSYSQSQMIQLECVNYCSQLNVKNFLNFFKKYFESSIYYLK
jgi:hypothetical protein